MLRLLLFFVCSVSYLSASVDTTLPLTDKPFTFVDLALSSHEKHILQALDIEQQETFDFYGSPTHMQDALRAFVGTIGTNSDEAVYTVTQVIVRAASDIVQLAEKQSSMGNSSCHVSK